MAVDPGLMMALSVHAHKGVYAVLSGSGVSRSAGIPTGWNVVKNLIKRSRCRPLLFNSALRYSGNGVASQ